VTNPAVRTVVRRRDRIARCALRKVKKPSGWSSLYRVPLHLKHKHKMRNPVFGGIEMLSHFSTGRSNARFTKPLKTHSSSLHPVAPSSSNTTRFATAERGRRSARLERLRPLRRPGYRKSPISSIFKLIEYAFFPGLCYSETLFILPLFLFPVAPNQCSPSKPSLLFRW